MFKRSQSGPRARLLRSSSSRNHQWKARALAYLGVLLFLCTVAFLQAKPKFSPAARHISRDPADSRDQPALERLADEQLGRNHVRVDERPGLTALARSSLDEVSLWTSGKDVETSLFQVSKQLDEQKATNDSFESSLEGDDYEDGNSRDDREVDVELETEELESLEDTRDAAVEGFDDVDDYEQGEKDELEEQVDLEERKVGIDKNLGVGREDENQLGTNKPKDLSDVSAGTVNTSDTREDGMKNSSNGDVETGMNRRFYRRFGTEKNNNDSDKRVVNDTRNLQRLGGIKTIPRWAPPEDLTINRKGAHSSARRSLSQTYRKNANHEKYGIIWDHLLGVTRRTNGLKTSKILPVAGKAKLGAVDDEMLLSSAENQVFSNVSSAGSTQIFSSDDEPLEQDLGEKLEEVTAIEDALLLRSEKGSLRQGLLHSWINSSRKKINKGLPNTNQQVSTSALDPLNPDNNPLLQDPDTVGSNGFTSGDNALRKALLRTSIEETPSRRNQ